VGLVALVVAVIPNVAHACAACAANDQGAFIVPTIVLSLLPLGMIGGGVYWWRKNSGHRWGGEFDERDDPVAPEDDRRP
jgi:hypothetical protein